MVKVLVLGSWVIGAVASAAGLSIVSPKPRQSLHDSRGHVSVLLALEDQAELPQGFAFRLLLDGKAAGADRAVKRMSLSGIDRGTHRLQALIVDADGQVLTRSPTVTFTLHRASRLNR